MCLSITYTKTHIVYLEDIYIYTYVVWRTRERYLELIRVYFSSTSSSARRALRNVTATRNTRWLYWSFLFCHAIPTAVLSGIVVIVLSRRAAIRDCAVLLAICYTRFHIPLTSLATRVSLSRRKKTTARIGSRMFTRSLGPKLTRRAKLTLALAPEEAPGWRNP